MARQDNNVVMKGVTGKVAGLILVKQYKYGTVVTKIPDRSKVVLSEKQKDANKNFRLAVEYARQVLRDPEKRAEYQLRLPEGKTVYHMAIAEYLAANSTKSSDKSLGPTG